MAGLALAGRQTAPMIVAGLACGIRLQWLVELGFGRQAGNHKNGRAGTQHMADRVGSHMSGRASRWQIGSRPNYGGLPCGQWLYWRKANGFNGRPAASGLACLAVAVDQPKLWQGWHAAGGFVGWHAASGVLGWHMTSGFIGWQVWQWRLSSHITFGKGGMRHVAFLAGPGLAEVGRQLGYFGWAGMRHKLALLWLSWHAASGCPVTPGMWWTTAILP